MPKQKYDNEAVNRSKAKVTELVKKGHRLNPDKASTHYLEAVTRSEKSPMRRKKARRDWEKAVSSGRK